jgi:hypothetical protein
VLYLRNPGRQVRAILAEGGYDAVWVFEAELASLVMRAVDGLPVVVDADDNQVDHIGDRLAQRPGTPKRMFLLEQRRRYMAMLGRLERSGAVVCFASSPDLPIPCLTLRNGLADPGHVAPGVRCDRPRDFAFLGSLWYAPNRRAALEAATEILPAIRALHPSTGMRAIGECDANLRAQLEAAGATVTGFVANLDDALCGVAALVLPVRQGSGTSVKVVEALARGVPVIATEFCVRGLGLQAGRHYLQAGTAEEFAQAWTMLLSDHPVTAERLARAGRAHYESSLSPQAVQVDVAAALARAGSLRPRRRATATEMAPG